MSKGPDNVPLGDETLTEGVLSSTSVVLLEALPLQSDAVAVNVCDPCNDPRSSIELHVAEPDPLALQVYGMDTEPLLVLEQLLPLASQYVHVAKLPVAVNLTPPLP